MKTLHNSDVSGARENVKDIQVFGNGDMFQLLCKASSEAEGWMKSTKAMEITDLGCVVQVTTQQRNIDGNYVVAEAVTFVPGVSIMEDAVNGGRKLVILKGQYHEKDFDYVSSTGHYWVRAYGRRRSVPNRR